MTLPPAFAPEDLHWFKATASSDHGACVEVAHAPENWVAVRDSKDVNRPGFAASGGAFGALIDSLRDGAL
ncbi:DUF397 domain-containing protein [Streptomyces sp. SID4931]|nr:DUF397 domain-containing protein [Streptomyces sp. SID4931]SCG08286.1 protein of unknown function [Streptomyces sp. Ncost-T6T-2b]